MMKEKMTGRDEGGGSIMIAFKVLSEQKCDGGGREKKRPREMNQTKTGHFPSLAPKFFAIAFLSQQQISIHVKSSTTFR